MQARTYIKKIFEPSAIKYALASALKRRFEPLETSLRGSFFIYIKCRGPPSPHQFENFNLMEVNMAYNKAKAEYIWRKQKDQEERKLRALGVDEDTIQQLHNYDWDMFKAERNYKSWNILMDSMSEIEEKEAYEPPHSVEALLDEIENEQLYNLLRELDNWTLQMLFYKSLGYTAKEIEAKIGMPESMVHNRISRLRKKVKKLL